MVHQYKLGGWNIVLDTCSGSVHVVDEAAYDIIALYKEKSREEIARIVLEKYAHRPEITPAEVEACLDAVGELEKAGKLFTPDAFAPMAGDFKARSGNVEGLMPARGPHLQFELLLLLCLPGEIPRGAGADAL